MQVYKLAMKRATDENEELRDIVSGLQQQMSELKLQLSERDEAIDQLIELANKLSDGELSQKLAMNL